MIRRLALVFGFVLSGALPAQAQHAGHGDGPQPPPPHAASSGHHRNTVALFSGVAMEGDVRALSIGLDYERRLSRTIGVGVLVDDTFGDLREYVGFAALFLHPTHAIRVDIAPGVEVRRLADEPDEWEFALRLGADYDVPLGGRWFIAPNVNVDLVGDRAVWVLGAELGLHF